MLLPVRNGEHVLPQWLDRVSTVAQGVITLDDGSTDGTGDILRSHPVVEHVITNPERDTYRGWDDRENRQRLIDVAAQREPSWLMFLDSDELLDETDLAALDDLVQHHALPGFAYGFEVFRMHDEGVRFDPRGMWVFRLFWSGEPDLTLPDDRLHFVPVPTAIPRTRWLQTSIRIQHFGSDTARSREARFEKYREADPDDEFDQGYASLLSAPIDTLVWPPRLPSTPIVLGVRGRYADLHGELSRGEAVALSVVVIAQNDEDVIGRSLSAVVNQDLDDEYEVLLVASGSDRTVDIARSEFPRVKTIQLPMPVLPGVARNIGLWLSRGAYITFPGSHVWLGERSLQHRLAAHDAGWDMVTTAVRNGNTSGPGWTSYLIDHSGQLPSRPSGVFHGAPGHASYVTDDLIEIGGFPIDMRAGEDTVVNQRLTASGRRAFYCSESIFWHASPSTTWRHFVKHRFTRGYALGRILRGDGTPWRLRRVLSVCWSVARRRVKALRKGVAWADPETRRHFARRRPAIALGLAASITGTATSLMRPGRLSGHDDVREHPAAPGHSPRIVAIGGRPGPGRRGLLAPADREAAARALEVLVEISSMVEDVQPALALNVTAASVTIESDGNRTISMSESVVDHYLRFCRENEYLLLLHLQPGGSTLEWLLEKWSRLLLEPGVGLLIDVRRSARSDGAAFDRATVTSRVLEIDPSIDPHLVFVLDDGNHRDPSMAHRVVLTGADQASLPDAILKNDRVSRLFLYE